METIQWVIDPLGGDEGKTPANTALYVMPWDGGKWLWSAYLPNGKSESGTADDRKTARAAVVEAAKKLEGTVAPSAPPDDLKSLLLEAREYIHGCDSDGYDPCECETCERATDLLDRVDAALARLP